MRFTGQISFQLPVCGVAHEGMSAARVFPTPQESLALRQDAEVDESTNSPLLPAIPGSTQEAIPLEKDRKKVTAPQAAMPVLRRACEMPLAKLTLCLPA